MNSKPLVSVIMGIYNCESTLSEALECIVSQTYSNWEIIMCDDHSTDNTREVAQKYVEDFPGRVELLYNAHNIGLNQTLNRCLEKAKGDMIARMDGDDTCSLDRFEKEIEALRQHHDIAIVSTDMLFFDENGVWGRTHVSKEPTAHSFLKATPFCHAACMVRKEAYDAVGGYSVSPRLLRVEDYHLWVKMYGMGYRGMNIQEPLYQMRDGRNAQKRRKFRYRVNEAYVKGYAIKHLGLPKRYYIVCLKPIIVGLMPSPIYVKMHRRK